METYIVWGVILVGSLFSLFFLVCGMIAMLDKRRREQTLDLAPHTQLKEDSFFYRWIREEREREEAMLLEVKNTDDLIADLINKGAKEVDAQIFNRCERDAVSREIEAWCAKNSICILSKPPFASNVTLQSTGVVINDCSYPQKMSGFGRLFVLNERFVFVLIKKIDTLLARTASVEGFGSGDVPHGLQEFHFVLNTQSV